MSLPAPRAGLVIRYSFLWSHESRAGAIEGRKDRPAAIVIATRKAESGDLRVVVAPITHEPPDDPAASIEVPRDVARALGFDGERQWIRLDELNRFAWPGFDLRPIPGRSGAFEYGMMPRSLYDQVKSGILERQKRGVVAIIPR
ncbi:MAG: growth inhibitor PemK [Alphaproteobacteria bacterium]|nr:growth inhibitor PemK [Alphaproteobacteria bacterium]